MVAMLIVAGAIGVYIWALTMSDSRSRQKERYQADAGKGRQVSNDIEGTPGDWRAELEVLRMEMERLEQRVYKKVLMICVTAIAVTVLLIEYFHK